uniref:F-actin-capping protein subunit beta n=1 Tax=Oncorhynchus tshawytscha TaxID=74940 RepID=A0A8C8D6G3_ONCTS
MNDQQLDCALDLMRRLPPQQIEKNLSDLIDLVPSLCEDLLSSVDQPLKIARDKVVGKDYLLCDYNRDGDSYRSPWSNKYEPPIDDGAMPSARLRKLEVEANNAFDQYRDLYFEGGVSSVYLWDLDHGFAGVILIKKAGDGSKKIKGCWDSIHVVEVQEKSSGRTAHYKLTSTVMLWLQTTKTGSGTMNLGGSLTRQMEKDETVGESSPHIANIGRLVEDMENKIRSTLNEIYFGKTKDIVNGLSYSCPIAATPLWTPERRRSRAMRPPKHDPVKPHCFSTHCSLNPGASRTNVSGETPSSWRLKSAFRRLASHEE